MGSNPFDLTQQQQLAQFDHYEVCICPCPTASHTMQDPVIVSCDRCVFCIVIRECLLRGPGGEPDEPEAADGLRWGGSPAGLLWHVRGSVPSAPAQGPHRSPWPQGPPSLIIGIWRNCMHPSFFYTSVVHVSICNSYTTVTLIRNCSSYKRL